MYLLSKEQIVPVFVFESQSAKLYNQLYAEHLQNQANINEQILSEQKSNSRTLMPEDIHDLKEYHSSNRSSPDSPQNMTHYPESHMSHDPRDMPHTHTITYESQMTHNDGRDSPINKMGEVIHITDSYEDEDIDVGDHVPVGDSNQLAKQNHLTSDLPIGSLVSPARHESQPQRQSVIVSLEDYARNQTFTPMSHDVTMSHGDVDTRVKIEPEYSVAPAKTVDLYPIKIEPNHDQLDDRHYEPKIDQSLSPYTPANSLRPIEEHNQYRGNDPDQRDRQFRCGFCHKVFRRKEEKKRHENSHLNIRSHKCKVCSKTFMRADHRNSHEKTHNKEKEFNCKICNKSFRRADEHKRHMTRQIHLRNVQRAKAAAAAKAGGQSSHSGMMHL